MSHAAASEVSHTGGRVLAHIVSTKLMAMNMTMAKAGMVRDLCMVGGVGLGEIGGGDVSGEVGLDEFACIAFVVAEATCGEGDFADVVGGKHGEHAAAANFVLAGELLDRDVLVIVLGSVVAEEVEEGCTEGNEVFLGGQLDALGVAVECLAKNGDCGVRFHRLE